MLIIQMENPAFSFKSMQTWHLPFVWFQLKKFSPPKSNNKSKRIMKCPDKINIQSSMKYQVARSMIS